MGLTRSSARRRIAAGHFSTLVALDAAGAFDHPDSGTDYMVQRAIDEFEFGLAWVLDGIEAFIRGSGSNAACSASRRSGRRTARTARAR